MTCAQHSSWSSAALLLDASTKLGRLGSQCLMGFDGLHSSPNGSDGIAREISFGFVFGDVILLFCLSFNS